MLRSDYLIAMISLRQLRYLVALAEHRHFGRAAEACRVTQPALSTQIRELETFLGVELVERRPGGAEVTAEGAEILRRATAIIAGVRDLEDHARQAQGLLAGPLTIGVIPSIAPYLLPICLPALGRQFPRLEPRLRETQTGPLLAELAAGKVDVAILVLPDERPDLESVALFADRFVLAAGVEEAAGLPERVQPGAVAADRLLLLEEGHCLREQALAYCRRIPAANLATLGATSLTTVLQMVAAGHGVTLLPELVLRAGFDDPRIALRRFEDPEPQRIVALAWRPTSPRRRDFAALAQLVTAAWEATAGVLPAWGRPPS
ncbi:LysR family transcriptional regulator [Allostella humosa]|nr:LysR substrate-binding domain-containing protein [Stella humosa]BBK29997.1 LysR family transcriptional regulator [Stella humosa]